MSSMHTALYPAREREREDEKKIQHERKQMQGGAVQMVVNLSRLANKQCFSVIIHKTALIALYHLTDAPCLTTTGCSGLSIIQLEARWLVCVGGPCAKGWRDNLLTVALMMLSRVPSITTPPPQTSTHTHTHVHRLKTTFSCQPHFVSSFISADVNACRRFFSSFRSNLVRWRIFCASLI